MITNVNELEWTLDQIERFQNALDALRRDVADSNPALFAVTSKTYEHRLRGLHDDVIAFLRNHPSEAPLHVIARGQRVGHGLMPARTATTLLDGLQSTVYAIGRLLRESGQLPREAKLRAVFGINLIATSPGSFIFSLDLASRVQPALFPEYDLGEAALGQLADYMSAFRDAGPQTMEVPRPVLLGLRKLADVLTAGVQEVEISYTGRTRSFSAILGHSSRDAILTRLGEADLGPRTVRGLLVAIDIDEKKCIIHTDEDMRIRCDYDLELEDELIRTLKHRVEMAGQTEPLERPAGAFRITRIERFRRIRPDRDSDDDEE